MEIIQSGKDCTVLWTREQIHAFAHSARESSHFADSSVSPESLSEALRQLGKQGVYLSFTLDSFSHTVYIPWTFCLCEATLIPFCVIEWMRFPLFFFPFSSGNS